MHTTEMVSRSSVFHSLSGGLVASPVFTNFTHSLSLVTSRWVWRSQLSLVTLSREFHKGIQHEYDKRKTDMITSIHTLIYSDDANTTRTFLRDVLGWKYVAEDFDKDWLIFKSGPSELGVHPTHSEWEGKSYDYPRHHSIALMCDDIDTTVGELRAKGAQFRGPIEEREYGRVIMMIVPGADDIQVYQPTHKVAYNL